MSKRIKIEDRVLPLLLDAAHRALDEDGADVLVLGSTTMHQPHFCLAERLSVPILSPGLVAFKTCEMLLDLGLSHSKRTFQEPERPADEVFSAAAVGA